MLEYQSTDHEQLMKRLRPALSVEEDTYPTTRQQASWSLDDLPRTVAFTMHQGSSITSMDFHPSHRTLLLVGCGNGEITLWEVGMREKLISKPFKIWDMTACSMSFQCIVQASVSKDSPISVSRVTWSPDGNYLGAAFAKHLVHVYAYAGPNDLSHHLEIDAHNGGVNDLALSEQAVVYNNCRDDKLIKVAQKVFKSKSRDRVIGLGGGIKLKDIKGPQPRREELQVELNDAKKENAVLKKRVDEVLEENHELKDCVGSVESKIKMFQDMLVK